VAADGPARKVLRALLDGPPLTRPELAARTGLSKPTISDAVRRLEESHVVGATGVRRGQPGRVPVYYGLAPGAGFVVAVDIGGDNLRARAAGLMGEELAAARRTTPSGGARAVLRAAVSMITKTVAEVGSANGEPRAVVVSAPGVVHADGRTVSSAYNLGEDGPFDLVTPIEDALGTPVEVDNNVNMAALGERWRGHGADVPTFAFVAVGAGIGMGLVHRGELVRGAHGAAGEVAYLPLRGRPSAIRRTGHGRELLSAEAGGYRMLERAKRRTWTGAPPETVAEIFARAESGDRAARALVRDEGRQIGLTVASACAVFDPEVVVLGGGVGSNPLLLPIVSARAKALLPFPPRIEISRLGEVASLTGALSVALTQAQTRLLNDLT
jgi:predicted NBD/HSP70 family sugar kinase